MVGVRTTRDVVELQPTAGVRKTKNQNLDFWVRMKHDRKDICFRFQSVSNQHFSVLNCCVSLWKSKDCVHVLLCLFFCLFFFTFGRASACFVNSFLLHQHQTVTSVKCWWLSTLSWLSEPRSPGNSSKHQPAPFTIFVCGCSLPLPPRRTLSPDRDGCPTCPATQLIEALVQISCHGGG